MLARKKIPQAWPSYKHWKGGNKKQTVFVSGEKKNQTPIPLKTSLPVNICYLCVNHSYLIGIYVLAHGCGVGRGGGGDGLCLYFLEWLFNGVRKKEVNIMLGLECFV